MTLPTGHQSLQPAQFDFMSPEFHADPYPTYRRLREETPAAWATSSVPGFWGFWFLPRYDDVSAALTDSRFVREKGGIVDPETLPPIPKAYQPLEDAVRKWLVFRDPPYHTRLRSLLTKSFTLQIVERMRPVIHEIVDQLLDAVPSTGEMEFIRDFAFPLPVIVIARLLGVPPEDQQQFKQWSSGLVGSVDPIRSHADILRGSRASMEITKYFHDLIQQRRSAPCDDLISHLIRAGCEEGVMTDDELAGTCIMLLVAGHETTVASIGNSMLSLLRNPEQLELLRHDESLAAPAVEELLRYISPTQIVFQYVSEDLEIGGVPIRKGQLVGAGIGGANRDPDHFTDPERLDITRRDNRHLAFSKGIHFCIGAHLARTELQIALPSVFARMPRVQLATEQLTWKRTVILRGLDQLPLKF